MATEAISREIPEIDGVEHLGRDLYRVPLALIEITEPDFEGDSELAFHNPRHAMDGDLKAQGFSKEEMDALRNSIRTEGLSNPPLCRVVEDADDPSIIHINIVDGERRKRSLDKLVETNTSCYDPAVDKFVPAEELYEFVEVRLRRQTPIEAYRSAFSNNDRAIPIGEGATVSFVRYLRRCKCSDEEILEITGKSTSWLRDTDALIDLDDTTFQALAKDEIRRAAAIKLAQIPLQERLATLVQAVEVAQSRVDNVRQKAVLRMQQHEEEEELAEAAHVEAQLTGTDTSVTEQKVKKAKQKAEKSKKVHEKVAKHKPRVSGKDISQASGGELKPLTFNKIKKFWAAPIQEIIKGLGKEEDQDLENIEVEDIYFVKLICDSMEAGNQDILKILRQHTKGKERRAARK